MRMMRGVIAGLSCLVWLTSGCGGVNIDPNSINPDQQLLSAYRVHPGDALDVKFMYHPADNARATVDTGGRMFLPVTGDLQVEGLTLAELEALIRQRSSRYLRDPVVAVSVATSQARAYVGGEVVSEGYVTLIRPTTVLQAILERGGLKIGADLSKVVVLSHEAGEPVAQELNLQDELEGDPSQRTLLAADQIVFVPKTGVAKANLWVDQYVNRMIPEFLTRMIRLTPFDP